MTPNEQSLISTGNAVLAAFVRYQIAYSVVHPETCDCPRCTDVAAWRAAVEGVRR